MLRSMTGFGAADRADGAVAFRVEVRTVNHRYLQVKCRVPAELASLEPEVDALARKKLARGAVTVHVSVERAPEAEVAELHPAVAKRYRARLEKLAKEAGLAGDVTLDHVLGLPGVVTDGAGDELRKRSKAAMRVVGAALDNLVEMREREGAAMEADLRKHADALRRLVARIAKRMPQVVKRAQTQLRKRVDELAGDRARVTDADLAREIALLADRGDVAEELARLDSHLGQLDAFLDKGGAIGRKLDFLVQEFFREVNTVGSKCSDAAVAHLVVEAKTTIERLREQVQNVE